MPAALYGSETWDRPVFFGRAAPSTPLGGAATSEEEAGVRGTTPISKEADLQKIPARTVTIEFVTVMCSCLFH